MIAEMFAASTDKQTSKKVAVLWLVGKIKMLFSRRQSKVNSHEQRM